MEKEYYLDAASTTPVFEEEFELMKKFNNENFYNPSASYMPSIQTKKLYNNARGEINKLLHGERGKLLFTSSATEANNTVFEGVHLRTGQTVLISGGEHPSVYYPAHELEKKGIIVKEIPLKETGVVDEEKFESMVDANVALISIIHVSNETGAVNDIKKLCKIAKSKNSSVLFHSDGVQAFCKIKVNLEDLDVDLYTISAHKVHAPRGIAGLWIKSGVKINPLLLGGGQEEGLRSSTENTLGAIAFEFAAKKLHEDFEKNQENVKSLKKRLIQNLEKSEIKDYFSFVQSENSSPYILSLSFEKIKAEVLVNALGSEKIYISTGSACSSKKAGNRILKAMGYSDEKIIGSVRISFSAYSNYTFDDIDYVLSRIVQNVLKLRKNIK